MGNESSGIFVAVLLMFVIFGLETILRGDPLMLFKVFVFSFIVIFSGVLARKIMAYLVDAGVEHRVWHFYRYGIRPRWHFDKEVPFGIIAPLFFTIFSLGYMKVATLLTYETKASKYRAAKRFGHYSYKAMTDWHNGLVGVAGIVVILLIALISYFIPGAELLAKMCAYYALVNMIPLSNLDGTQIFFGNRILYSVLGVITLIFAAYAFIL